MAADSVNAWLLAVNTVVQILEASLRIKDRQAKADKLEALEKRVTELEAKLKEASSDGRAS